MTAVKSQHGASVKAVAGTSDPPRSRRIGWLVDEVSQLGGAELTQAEFRAAAPDDVEVVDCRPGEIAECDAYVVHNCLTYSPQDIEALEGKPAWKFWHDVGPHVAPEVRAALERLTDPICCSPLQAKYMNLERAKLIPPPVDIRRFEEAAVELAGEPRRGAVSVAAWQNYGKAAHRAAEWAQGNGGMDFFGGGPFAPPGSEPVPYAQMAALLAHYRTFVFLPTVIEPFGRLVVEAWAAGCELVVNDLIGARWWITEKPRALHTAARDFWALVLGGE